MDKETWAREYKKLVTAYNKTTNSEQARVYFEALSSFPGPCVADAVTSAIRESKHWPAAADLAERARLARPAHMVPAEACDVCHGSTWTQHDCAGVGPSNGRTGPEPIEHTRFCGVRDVAHQSHTYARRCSQCWVGTERGAA